MEQQDAQCSDTCNTDSNSGSGNDDSTSSFLRTYFCKGTKVLDVRDMAEYTQRRLKRSKCIPWSQVDNQLHELPPKQDAFVVVCPSAKLAEVQGYFGEKAWTVARFVSVPPADTSEADEFWRQASDAGVLETHADPISPCQLFEPCPLLSELIHTIEQRLMEAHGQQHACERFACCDVGAGAGRDVVWLAARHKGDVNACTKHHKKECASEADGADEAVVEVKEGDEKAEKEEQGKKRGKSRSRSRSRGRDDKTSSRSRSRSRSRSGDAGTSRKSASPSRPACPSSSSPSPCTSSSSSSSSSSSRSCTAPHTSSASLSSLSASSSPSAQHTPFPGWSVVAVDYIVEAIKRVRALAQSEHVTEHVTPLRAKILPGGRVRVCDEEEMEVARPHSFKPPKPGVPEVANPRDFTLRKFDLVLCVRMLERDFLPTLRNMVALHGFILYQTFVQCDVPLLKPNNPNRILRTGELAQVFSEQNGFRVLVDRIDLLAEDGRPVNSFCAQRIA